MMPLLRIVVFVLALTGTGYSLSCIECISETLTTCTGKSVTCLPGYLCGSLRSGIIFGPEVSSGFSRGCMFREECDFKGNISWGQQHLGTAATCCSEDNCTPPAPSLISSNNAPNGLVCKTCTSTDATNCDSNETLRCTGNQNKCILQTSHITGPGNSDTVSSLRGCATKSYCDRGSFSINNGKETISINVVCSGGGFSARQIVLTPIILCLLLLI